MSVHPLITRIVTQRALIKELEQVIQDQVLAGKTRGLPSRRQRLRDESLHLEGLEEAAQLSALGPDDWRVLLDDLRQDREHKS